MALPLRMVRRLLVNGQIPVPYVRVGRTTRVNKAAFEEWLKTREADSLGSKGAQRLPRLLTALPSLLDS